MMEEELDPAKKAPTMSSLFGSDSEDDDSQNEGTQTNKSHDAEESTKGPQPGDDTGEKDDDDDDVEFQEDGITGSSVPRARVRIQQPKATVRFSNNDEYDDSNDAGDRNLRYSDGDMLDESTEALPPRQIVLSEAPTLLTTDEPDILSTYALSTKANLTFHLVQLPKIVTINPEEFDAASFNAKAEEEEFQRPVHNMIRWRYVSHEDTYNHESESDGGRDMESNANIIQWSDGTFGLAIGDEVFELDEFPFSSTNPETKISATVSEASKDEALASKDFLYLSSKAELRSLDESHEDEELKDNDDLEDAKISTILQCIVPLQSKLIPRPASITSAAHKAFILAEKSRTIKRANIGEHVPVKDPELEKAERIRNNEDLNKQKKRYSSGEAKSTFGGYSGGRRSSGQRYQHDEDDDDDKYDSINIKDLKRKSHDMDIEEDYGDNDDDEEEDEWSKRKKKVFLSARDSSKAGLRSSRAFSDESDDDGKVGNAPTSDDDDDKDQVKRVATHKKRSSVFAEDDDDD